jgi:hypothetical protein
MLPRLLLVGLLGAAFLLGGGCGLDTAPGGNRPPATTGSADRADPAVTAKASPTRQVTLAVSGMH